MRAIGHDRQDDNHEGGDREWFAWLPLCSSWPSAAARMRTGDLTLVSTKNIASLRQAEVRGQFEASNCKVFGIPNMKEAIDRTIEKGNGNALI